MIMLNDPFQYISWKMLPYALFLGLMLAGAYLLYKFVKRVFADHFYNLAIKKIEEGDGDVSRNDAYQFYVFGFFSILNIVFQGWDFFKNLESSPYYLLFTTSSAFLSLLCSNLFFRYGHRIIRYADTYGKEHGHLENRE